jgi:hypothetical protein
MAPLMNDETWDHLKEQLLGTTPMFTKRHYETLAKAIAKFEAALHHKAVHLSLHEEIMGLITGIIALELAVDNRAFDSMRFEKAARSYVDTAPELRQRREASKKAAAQRANRVTAR